MELPLDNDVVKPPEQRAGGRPLAISDDTLFNLCERFTTIFVTAWGDLGRLLMHARTRAAAEAAFATIVDPGANAFLLKPFLHATTTPSSAADVRRAVRALDQIVPQEFDLTTRVREAVERLQTSTAAARGGSARVRKTLLHERRKRLINLEYVERERAVVAATMSTVCARRADLEAAFAQDQLLGYLEAMRKRPIDHNPRNLARAVAGLPQIGWWQSFRRCVDHTEGMWPSAPYLVFELIVEAWTRRKDESARSLILAVRTAVEGMNTIKRGGRAAQQYASRNWPYLRRAIASTDLRKAESEEVPYLVFREFFKQIGQPRKIDEVVLAERETLALGSGDSQAPKTARRRRLRPL
jgi:hypothetical protein